MTGCRAGGGGASVLANPAVFAGIPLPFAVTPFPDAEEEEPLDWLLGAGGGGGDCTVFWYILVVKVTLC